MTDRNNGRFQSVRRILDRLPSSAVRAGSLGVVDQAVISGVSFIIMVATARMLGPASFGVFSLLYTVLLLAHSVQNALITSPLNVIGATKTGEEFRRYASSAGGLQLGLAGVFLAISLGAALLVIPLHSEASRMLLAMGFAITGWQIQEFTRRVLFTESRFPPVLWNDLLTYGLRLIGLWGLWSFTGLSGAKVFSLMGITWFVGAIVGVFQIRGLLARNLDLRIWREHWDLGRWLFASEMVANVPRYVSAAVVSAILSVSAYGAYRAFSQIVQATNVPLQAMNSLVRPKLARDAQQGKGRVWKTMKLLMAVGAIGFAVFAVALMLFSKEIVSAAFGREYEPYASILLILAFVPLFRVQEYILGNGYQALRNTQVIFTGTVFGVVSGTALGALLILLFGVPAAGSITLLTTAISAIALAYFWNRRSKSTSIANIR